MSSMIYPILRYMHPLLTTRTPERESWESPAAKWLSYLRTRMEMTMWAAKGIGLAANQVGESERAIIVSSSRDETHFMVNPVIHDIPEHAATDVAGEGCLSMPGVEGLVRRKSSVAVTWRDVFGRHMRSEFHGALARVIQHEVDHLNGILFVQRMAPDSPEALRYPELKNLAIS